MTSALTLTIEGSVAVVTFDLPGEAVNKYSRAVITEFDAVFNEIEGNAAVRGVVLISGKPDVFIAGADIDEFLTFTTAGQAAMASWEGQERLARLSRFRAPVVAAINGACVGGGLETALACTYRIASDHPKTVLGLPETQLGLIPGMGGTQRLPRKVGLQAALDMILTGKQVRAKKAMQMGLIEELVHPSILRRIAVHRAAELGAGASPPPGGPRRGLVGTLLESNPLGRAIIFRQARAMTLGKTRGNYPALPAAIEAVAAGYRSPKGYAEEARLFGEMAMTPVSRQLINIFYATNALKKDTGVEGGGPPARDVTKLGVVGTGFMGAGIAAVTAMQGVPVRFKDVKLEQVGRGLGAVRDVLNERFKRKQVTRQEFTDQMSLVSGTVDWTGFGNAALLIEAVFEDVAVKRTVVRDAEGVLPADAIVATNTSTIPIATIAEASKRPERVIGMHFFSPVHRMPLLEVIVTPRTAPDVVTTVVAFGKKLGKTVIIVRDSPGFFANRILAPYLTEAGRLLDEGVAIDAIDRALLDWGFPVGPITLLDEVGLDIATKSGGILAAAFGERLKSSASLTRLIETGRLGRKNGKGFFRYDAKGKKREVDETVYALLPAGAQRVQLPAVEIQHRCALAMVNEAVRCLEEGIVREPRHGDIGAVFGIGFPPFRGGPYRFVDTVGADTVVRALEDLNARHTGRFVPCELLKRMAAAHDTFY